VPESPPKRGDYMGFSSACSGKQYDILFYILIPSLSLLTMHVALDTSFLIPFSIGKSFVNLIKRFSPGTHWPLDLRSLGAHMLSDELRKEKRGRRKRRHRMNWIYPWL
jgi:hypothetical protein